MEPIVVGTDGSAHADQAVSWAASDAVRKGRPLHIVHGHRLPNGIKPKPSEDGEHVLTAAMALAAEGRPGLAVTAERSNDRAEIALANHARRSAEIVIGHRGRDGFHGLLLGSVGLRLAGQIPGPVVVVRGVADADHKAVAVGIDGFDVSYTALEYACRTAVTSGSRLIAVQAWPTSGALNGATNAVFTKHLVTDAARHLERVMEPCRARFPELTIDEKIIVGHPVGTLVDVSAAVDLLVVGSRGTHTLKSALMGSVSHGVMHYSHCPVAVVRPRSSGNGEVSNAG